LTANLKWHAPGYRDVNAGVRNASLGFQSAYGISAVSGKFAGLEDAQTLE
jgi:hypothetical protein